MWGGTGGALCGGYPCGCWPARSGGPGPPRQLAFRKGDRNAWNHMMVSRGN